MTPRSLEAVADRETSVELEAPFDLPFGPHSPTDRLIDVYRIYRVSAALDDHGQRPELAWLAVKAQAIDWFDVGEFGLAEMLPLNLYFEPWQTLPGGLATRHRRQRVGTHRASPQGCTWDQPRGW